MTKSTSTKSTSTKTAKPAKAAKPELVTTKALKAAKVVKEKGPVPNYTKKTEPVKNESSFDEKFEALMEKQKATFTSVFSSGVGVYAVAVEGEKMVVGVFQNEKGFNYECLGTNFGFASHVFIGAGLIFHSAVKDFEANYHLPRDVQQEQKNLHLFLRAAYELTDTYKAKIGKAETREKAKFTLVPKEPQIFNKFAGFAREEKTCSDIRQLVLGRVQVYRIADATGKYAVFSLSTIGEVVKVTRVSLKFVEPGHELEHLLDLNTMVELHKLNLEYLGKPHGEFEKQQRNQGVLHAWLRKMALDAGMKDREFRKVKDKDQARNAKYESNRRLAA